jgi:hypothetical protein
MICIAIVRYPHLLLWYALQQGTVQGRFKIVYLPPINGIRSLSLYTPF